MRYCLKPVAWILLALIIALPAMAQASAFEKPSQTAGCDQHSDRMPSQPASYTCCQSGHDTAALQRIFNLHAASGQMSSVLDSASPTASLTDVSIPPTPLVSDSPPLPVSLRI